MNQIKTEVRDQPQNLVPWFPADVNQQTSNSLHAEFQDSSLMTVRQVHLLFTPMASIQSSQPLPASSFQDNFILHPLSSLPSIPIHTWPSSDNTLPPQPGYEVKVENMDASIGPQIRVVDLAQLLTPPSGIPMGYKGTRHQDAEKLLTAAEKQREKKLKKNRECAQRCRQRKKQYFTYLENRVRDLENENKKLKENIEVIKTYWPKVHDE